MMPALVVNTMQKRRFPLQPKMDICLLTFSSSELELMMLHQFMNEGYQMEPKHESVAWLFCSTTCQNSSVCGSGGILGTG